MKQYFRTAITFVILVIVLFGLYYFSDWFSKTTGYALGENEKQNLAACLQNKDAVFYKSNNCPDCEKQLELFGKDAARMLNVVVCQNADECPAGGVPAWKIGKQTYYGVRQLTELISVSGCSII